ncbi:MAG: lipoprotein [Gammaproteobacteria bacterium]|nr:lipoprotein [Gammaproteobacteria bacterium]MBV9696345.1 lipoprotein [Gammaproteobacteria bacterium]
MNARLVLLLGIGALSACGQKGPLYLPDKRAGVVTQPAPGDSAPPPPAPTPPAPPKADDEDEPR